MIVPTTRRPVIARWLPALEFALFFTGFFLYVWLLVEPHLVYHGLYRLLPAPIRFQTDWRFFAASLSQVGGLLAYLSGFCSHCFAFPYAGVAIITAVAGLFWLVSLGTFRAAGAYCPPVLNSLYAAALLIAYASYHQPLSVALSVLAAVAAHLVYMKASGAAVVRSVGLFVAAFAFLYYAAGSAAIEFGLLVGLYELVGRGRKLLAVAFSVVTVATYLVGAQLLDLSVHILQPMTLRVGDQPTFLLAQYSVYALQALPFVVILAIWVHKHVVRPGAADGRGRPASTPPSVASKVMVAALRGLRILAPLALIPLGYHLGHRTADTIYLKSSYYVSTGQWDKVIELHDQYSDGEYYTLLSNHDINLALYHTGQLGEKMFSYEQSPHALLLITQQPADKPYSAATGAKMIELLIELGHLGDAERIAFELLESTNEWPFIVEKLALIQLAKGQTETATVFLNALSKDLVRGASARELLRRVADDPELAGYEPVQRIRAVASETDLPTGRLKVDDIFTGLLQKNPKNKMAFEYMMAFYMLSGQAAKLVANLPRLETFQYDAVPFHYQEALAMLASRGMSRQRLHGYWPGPGAVKLDRRFVEAGGRRKEVSREDAKCALRQEFGGTFIYYNVFGSDRTDYEAP